MLAYCLRKFWVIVLGGVLCSSVLVLEKYYTTNFDAQYGQFVFSCDMSVDDYDANSTLRLDIYLKDAKSRIDLLRITEKQFDYKKFNVSWDNKTFSDKCRWLNKSVIVKKLDNRRYNVSFVISDCDVKNYDYCINNGEKYLLMLCSYIKGIDETKNVFFSKPVVVSPERKVVSKTKILTKYGIIGCIIGVILTVIVLSVIKKRSNYIGY